MTAQPFSPEEMTRYSRHLLLPEVGMSGQKKLQAARILVVGSGGLGSPIALYLAAAGVGKIGLVDFDAIDLSNLQRQILFSTIDVGKSKTKTAARRLKALNKSIKVVTHEVRIDSGNVLSILGGYDIVVDGTDNFATRYLLNDACVRVKKPYVYGSIFKFEGQASVFAPDKGCYRCLFPAMPDQGVVPNCAEIGVLGAVAGVIGCLQAVEAIKLVLGVGDTLSGRLLLFDAFTMSVSELPIARDPGCTVCGDERAVEPIADEKQDCAVAGNAPGNAEPAAAASSMSTSADKPGDLHWVPAQRDIAPADLSKLLKQSGETVLLLDVRTPEEFVICSLEGAQLIPLIDLPGRLQELEKDQHIVVYCHHGVRSRSACQLLRESGFDSVSNLRGGISAWSREVDSSVPQY
jgi:adenylyltransferase/sulfurtransferase